MLKYILSQIVLSKGCRLLLHNNGVTEFYTKNKVNTTHLFLDTDLIYTTHDEKEYTLDKIICVKEFSDLKGRIHEGKEALVKISKVENNILIEIKSKCNKGKLWTIIR